MLGLERKLVLYQNQLADVAGDLQERMQILGSAGPLVYHSEVLDFVPIHPAAFEHLADVVRMQVEQEQKDLGQLGMMAAVVGPVGVAVEDQNLADDEAQHS